MPQQNSFRKQTENKVKKKQSEEDKTEENEMAMNFLKDLKFYFGSRNVMDDYEYIESVFAKLMDER